jgi:hypothetical protein
MNCPDCHDLLQQYLDTGIAPDPARLEPHLAVCEDCRGHHSAALRLAEGLRLLARPVPPAGLAGRIVGNVLGQHQAALRFRRRLRIAVAVAAGLLFLLFAGSQGLFGPQEKEPQQVDNGPAPSHPKKDKTPGVSPPAASLGQSFTDAGTAALALTLRTADETVDEARRWLPPAAPLPDPIPVRKAADPLKPVWKPLTQAFRQAGHSVSEGLQPVTSSAPRAMDVIWRVLGPLQAEEKAGS